MLQPSAPGQGNAADATLPRLPSVYPQILSVLQRPVGAGGWPGALQAPLSAAEAASRRSGHAEMALVDLPAGRFHLVLASTPASHALQIDLRGKMVDDACLELDRFIDNAAITGVSEFYAVHGKGTGALRA